MPEQPSRIGFSHQLDFSDASLAGWLADLEALQAGWLCLRAPSDQAVPEAFVKGLLAAGVEPILHLPCLVGELRPAELTPLLYSYAHWGARYVVVYDRPNLKGQWADYRWNRTGLVDRFLDATLPILQAQHAAGLRPILPPLEPGGDYWDTAFLESALKGLARRAQTDLLDALVLAIDARCHGRPPDWGAGGSQAWPLARPYHTPEGSQDHIGFRLFEWYREITERTLGSSRPMLALSAGAAPEAAASGEINAGLARWLRGERASTEGLLAACFERVPPAPERLAWFREPATRDAKSPSAAKTPSPGSKRLAHYLLLPADEGRAIKAWRHASAFALTHRPVVGFSAREAALAESVTIAGGPEVVSLEVEADLQRAGCRVQRLTLLPSRKSACRPNPGPRSSDPPVSP